jgi:aryl-alcohol dehydrogenase-like predicted oxidoreductase
VEITRREFVGAIAIGGIAASAAWGSGTLPTRVLGRTGRKVTILAFGSGSRFLKYDEDTAFEALNRALDRGIDYVDTAGSYGKGRSEKRIGRVMKTRRSEVFLATKLDARKADRAKRSIERSLKRLQTDHVDLLHIHNLRSADDLAAIEAPGGVLGVLYKMREEKVARAIGITCHADPEALRTALERHDFDCTQMALNAALSGPSSPRPNPMGRPASFETVALPVATRKQMGVIAMKVFAQDGLQGQATPEELIRYSLSLPVTTAVIGMPKLEFIDANIETARSFKPLTAAEMEQLSGRLAATNKAALDRIFRDHIDC